MLPERYQEMARECLQEAAGTKDAERTKALLGIAKLYNQTALAMEATQVAQVVPLDLDQHNTV